MNLNCQIIAHSRERLGTSQSRPVRPAKSETTSAAIRSPCKLVCLNGAQLPLRAPSIFIDCLLI